MNSMCNNVCSKRFKTPCSLAFMSNRKHTLETKKHSLLDSTMKYLEPNRIPILVKENSLSVIKPSKSLLKRRKNSKASMELNITENDNTIPYTNFTRIKIRTNKAASREISPKKQVQNQLDEIINQRRRNNSLVKIIAHKNALKIRQPKPEVKYIQKLSTKKLLELSHRKESLQVIEDECLKDKKTSNLALPDDTGFRSLVSFMKDIKGMLSAPQTYRQPEAKQSIGFIKQFTNKCSEANRIHSFNPVYSSQSNLFMVEARKMKDRNNKKAIVLKKNPKQITTMPKLNSNTITNSDIQLVPKFVILPEHSLFRFAVTDIKIITPPL